MCNEPGSCDPAFVQSAAICLSGCDDITRALLQSVRLHSYENIIGGDMSQTVGADITVCGSGQCAYMRVFVLESYS